MTLEAIELSDLIAMINVEYAIKMQWSLEATVL